MPLCLPSVWLAVGRPFPSPSDYGSPLVDQPCTPSIICVSHGALARGPLAPCLSDSNVLCVRHAALAPRQESRPLIV